MDRDAIASNASAGAEMLTAEFPATGAAAPADTSNALRPPAEQAPVSIIPTTAVRASARRVAEVRVTISDPHAPYIQVCVWRPSPAGI